MILIFTASAPLFLFLLPLHLWFQPFSSIAASCLEWCFSRPSWKFLFFLTLELSRTQNKVLQKYLKIDSWDLMTDIIRRRKKYDVLITNICYWYIAHAFDVHAKCTKVHGLRFYVLLDICQERAIIFKPAFFRCQIFGSIICKALQTLLIH